jgi:hypothetical protein
MLLRVWLIVCLIFAGLVPAYAIAPETTPPAACFEHEIDDGRPRRICITAESYSADVCAAIERSATVWGLPPGYFARLIWQESHFDPNALSRAGARGIAQFMPGTGRLQGLRNAFDPSESLWRSARYLAFLAKKFGNLGLAAAAYNGGEGRVSRFIAGTGYLAVETIDYVRIVTGTPVIDWLAGGVGASDYALDDERPFWSACVKLADSRTLTPFTPPVANVQSWGIQLAQFFSADTARNAFERIKARYPKVLGAEPLMLVAKRNPNFGPALRYTAEIGRDTRAAAQTLCDALSKAGGVCIVVRNN